MTWLWWDGADNHSKRGAALPGPPDSDHRGADAAFAETVPEHLLLVGRQGCGAGEGRGADVYPCSSAGFQDGIVCCGCLMGQRRTYRKAQVALGLSGLCQVQGDMNVAPLLHMLAAYSGQRQKPASEQTCCSRAMLR